MSFYVDTQQEALQLGLSRYRTDLANLTLKQMEQHPDIKVRKEKITGILDTEGKFAQESIVLDVEKVPVLIGSSPFRSGYDIWAINRETGFGIRIGP